MRGTGFIAGVIVGVVLTRLFLNQYVQDRGVFMRKEKHLLDELKKERAKNGGSV
jgi:uncharacterized membrane-anchored protein YhcB (DUF1043 family)